MNVLFVCTMGWLRSRTAAQLFGSKRISTMHCGTDEGAAVPMREWYVTQWADAIVCMEQTHKHAVQAAYPETQADLYVLGVPDIYDYMDPELVATLKARVPTCLGTEVRNDG